MVSEAGFVATEILQGTNARPVKDFNIVPFPAVTAGANASAIETSGDEIITFRNTPAIQAFVKYLATAKAAEIWAKLGGLPPRHGHVTASLLPGAGSGCSGAPAVDINGALSDRFREQ